jgi:hypothetical protein
MRCSPLLAIALFACSGGSSTDVQRAAEDVGAERDGALDAMVETRGDERDAALDAPDDAPDDAHDDAETSDGAVRTKTVALHDVSVLLPLAAPTSPTLLRLDAAGRGGALLPKASYDAIPLFRAGTSFGAALAFDTFRIVAARIDPCFPDPAVARTTPSLCRTQLRLVAQPIVQGPLPGGFSASDSAIHLLYDLPKDRFETFARQWIALGDGAPRTTASRLGIHPILAREGDGATARALRALILREAGPASLTQVTFMRGDDIANWHFGGFAVSRSGLSALEIFGLAGAERTIQRIQFGFGGVTDISPSSPLSRDLEPFFGKLEPVEGRAEGTLVLTGTPSQRQRAMETALRIQNPLVSHAENVDCATCHHAGPLARRAESLGVARVGTAAFVSDRDLATDDGPNLSLRDVRAFGYFGDRPAIAERTVHESAVVADLVEDLLAR